MKKAQIDIPIHTTHTTPEQERTSIGAPNLVAHTRQSIAILLQQSNDIYLLQSVLSYTYNLLRAMSK